MLEVSNILWLSVIMQCVAVVMALRLIPKTRRALAWILLSAAFLLMATRRTMSLLREEGYMQDSWLNTASTEIVALIISALMVAGVFMIRRIFEQQRRDSVQVNKLSSVVEQSPTTTMILNSEGKVEYVNPAFTKATGDSLIAMAGEVPDILQPGYTDEYTSKRLWDSLRSGGVWSGEIKSSRRDGAGRWELVRISPVISEDFKVTHHVVSLEDITQSKEQHEELEHMALHDALTGLPNRTLFFDRLGQSIKLAASTGNSLAVMLMDLDNFKDVNDSLGHTVGDRILREIGARLRRAIHTGDTVARMGGDEFLVLIPEAKEEKCSRVVNRIYAAMKEPFMLGDLKIELGISIGLSMYPEDGMSADVLLQHADVAMYEAKKLPGRYARYNEAQDEGGLHRLTLASELRTAIEGKQLLLHYQPLINFDSKKPDKVEALVRWQHPERGLLYPDTFIPLAEQTGYISSITEWVIDNALQQLSEWRRSNIDLGISINVSVVDLGSLGLPALINGKINEFGIDPSLITLEITESVLMLYTQKSLDDLTTLRNIGVHISIDDFGTGYSSLQHLKELPISELKIDKSFVINMLSDDDDAIIVRAIIDLAHNLGLTIVAEGIENQEILDILEILGCNRGQGYHIGYPMSAEQLMLTLMKKVPLLHKNTRQQPDEKIALTNAD